MTIYEFSLRQEVLLEMGASVLGDIFRYILKNDINSDTDPVEILYGLVHNAKQDILISKTIEELDKIEGQFILARSFIAAVEKSQSDKPSQETD